MGNYASTSDLTDRFDGDAEVSYLTDTEETGTPDTDVLTDCIESAEAEINTWIAQRVATPVDVSVDTELARLMKRKTIDLAEVYLLRRGPQVSDEKVRQEERVIEWAKAIGKGEARLTGAVTVESTGSRDPLASWTGSDRDLTDVPTRIFSRETMSSL